MNTEDQFRRLIEDIGEGLASLDVGLRFTFANKAARDIFGVSPGDLTGRCLEEFLFPEEFRALLQEQQRRQLEKNRYELTIVRVDGEQSPLLLTTTPRFDMEGRYCGSAALFRDNTDHDRAEVLKASAQCYRYLFADLQLSEAKYRQIVETATEGIAIIDPDGLLKFVNRAAAEMFRAPVPQLLGRSLFDFLDDEGRATTSARIEKRRQGFKEQDRFELKFRRSDGDEFWAMVSAVAIWDDEGNYSGTLEMITDISRLKRAEQAVRENEERLRLVLEGTHRGVWDEDLRTGVVSYSRCWKAMLGYEEHEIADGPAQFEGRVHPQDWDRVHSAVARYLARESSAFSIENRIRCKDGTYKWVLARGQAVWDSDGTPTRFVGSISDISERKAMEAQLRATAERLQTILENAPVGIDIISHDGRIIESNGAYQRIVGYSGEELKGMTFSEYTHPDDLPHNLALLGEAKKGNLLHYELEKRYVRKDGRTIWVRVITSRLDDEHCVGIAEDITERKEAVEQLRRSETRLRRLIDSNIIGAIVRREAGQILEANDAFLQMTGYTREDLAGGLNWRELTVPEYEARDDAMIEEMRQLGRFQPYEKEYFRKDGSRVSVLTAGAMTEADEAIVFVFDLTERKLVEAELHEAKEAAEKASRAKGAFLATMSHEIRTPMNGVLGMLDLALDTDLKPEQFEYLHIAKSSADTLLRVVDDILDFSKIESGKLEFETVDFSLNDTLGDALDALSLRAEDKGLELTCQIHPEIPEFVTGDPGRLRQVVTNLVGNAIKFTERGEILVEIQQQERSDQDVTVHFSVHDTGIGIPSDRQEAIFVPFEQADSSTTREYGGTGLGLTISAQLVNIMGGQIWVESEPGQGSTFHFTSRFRLAQSPSRVTHKSVELEGLRALVVDDNATNRCILLEMLSRWRMQPSSAADGETALVIMERARIEHRPFQLVIVDAQMPGIDGFGVVEKIKQDPDLAAATIMMLSSARRRGDVARCKELGIAAYLTKPIRQAQLFEAIIAALGNASWNQRPTALAARHTVREGRSLEVLLAEDNAVNQKIAARLLEKLGHRVVVVGNGREVLDHIQHQEFDLILMDIQMPEMDGFTATAAIRRQEQKTGKHIGIVALTAHALDSDREQCLRAGMDAYVSKPIQTQKLSEAIKLVIAGGISSDRRSQSDDEAATGTHA